MALHMREFQHPAVRSSGWFRRYVLLRTWQDPPLSRTRPLHGIERKTWGELLMLKIYKPFPEKATEHSG